MKVRPARGMNTTIYEAMEEVHEIKDWFELMEYLKKEYYWLHPNETNIKIEPYGFDERINWNTHILTVDGHAAVYTDGLFPPPEPKE